MKRFYVTLVTSLVLTLTACNGQDKTPVHSAQTSADSLTATYNRQLHPPFLGPLNQQDPGNQISPFVRRIFQDQVGSMWFGTNGDGVIRYQGDSLQYLSVQQGFGGVAVRAILGDRHGNVWFGTNGGLTKYVPAQGFTNYTEQDGLVNNDIWTMTFDQEGILWIGTLEGVSRFDGKEFTHFNLPETVSDPSRGVTSTRIVHHIMEDSKERMWFATNGGAFIYDPSASDDQARLTNISEKDGLCNNVVNCVLEDQQGNIWFATHHNGVCRWDGKSFTRFTAQDGVEGPEAWDLYQDRSGNIWFPTEGYGVFRYNGSKEYPFTNFSETEGLASRAVQCTFEDKDGRIWCGGWLGLYRYDPSQPEAGFVNLTKELPWD